MKELLQYIIKFDIKKLFKEQTNNIFIQFFRYLFVGGFAAIVNIGMLYVFVDLLNIYCLISNIMSFILGLITGCLGKKIVQQSS